MGLGPTSTSPGSETLKHTLVGTGPVRATAANATAAAPAVNTPADGGRDDDPPAASAMKSTIVGVGPASLPAPSGATRSAAPAPAARFAPAAPAAPAAPPLPPPSEVPAPRPSLRATLRGPSQHDVPQAPPRRSAPPEIVEGSVFAGDLRIVRHIARGGMGTVYEAEQLSTGRRRALKILHRAHSLDERHRQRFLQEARITSRIESEHIVDVVMAGADASTGTFWIAMEMLDGETLAERLLRVGGATPLPDAESWRILTQLSRGLARAHAQGVVHRDLKPANVFLAKGEPFTVKLLDFGIAHLLDDAVDATEGLLGTPLWMAPEQAQRGEITPTADIWAAGLLGFRVFTGRCYWLSARKPVLEMSALLTEMLDRPLPRASERAEALGCTRRLPDGFDAWFARCVARDPGLRFRSADEMAIALQEIVPDVGSMPVIEYTPSPARPQTPASARPYPRRDSVRPPSPLARAIVEEELRVPRFDPRIEAAPDARPSPIPLVRAATRPPDPRPRGAATEPALAPRDHPAATGAPSPPYREPTGERPRLASPAEQTAKLAALTQTAKRLWLRRALALGAVMAIGVAAVGVAVTRARNSPALPATALAPLSPAELQSPWLVGDSRHWQGTMTGDATSWSFVLVLRQTLSGQVAGYVSWTARRAPGVRPGEQVRENVEGNWDAPTRSLELHGTASTNPIVLPVNAYRIVVAPDGTITGTAMDSSSQLVGQRARPTD